MVQGPAPNFEGMAVVNGEFKKISLQDYKGKYLVLFFYPLDLYVIVLLIFLFINVIVFAQVFFIFFSTFVCPTEIRAYSDAINQFRDIGAEVVGCSTDSHFSHLAWINMDKKVNIF